MSKLTIIKLGLMPVIVGWWAFVFVMLNRMEEPGEFETIAWILSGALLLVGFVFFCRWTRFLRFYGGEWTKESLRRFQEYNLAFGALQLLTGNRFTPRKGKDGQPIDDAGMVRACKFDSFLELTMDVLLVVAAVAKIILDAV